MDPTEVVPNMLKKAVRSLLKNPPLAPSTLQYKGRATKERTKQARKQNERGGGENTLEIDCFLEVQHSALQNS